MGDRLCVYVWVGGKAVAFLSPLAGYDCASVYASSILMAQITYAACVAGEELLCPHATCCLCVVAAVAAAAKIYYLQSTPGGVIPEKVLWRLSHR